MDNQEQSRFQEKAFQQKASEKPESKTCNACSTLNNYEAKFCEECGASLTEELKCPKCNSKVYPNADICEACGHWLLDKQCKFCSSPVDPNETFCGECGNPVAGIVCHSCQHLSYFDFCPKCNTPLTEFALEAIKQIQNDPVMSQMQNLFQEIAQMEQEIKEESVLLQQDEAQAKQEELVDKEEEERQKKLALLNSISGYIQKSQKETPKPQTQNIPKPEVKRESLKDALKRAQDIASKNQERARKNREAQEKLNKMKSLTFQNPQEARKFFKASKPPRIIGWRCARYEVLHNDPSECAEPHGGGVWVIDTSN
jgi:hypothetical protein